MTELRGGSEVWIRLILDTKIMGFLSRFLIWGVVVFTNPVVRKRAWVFLPGLSMSKSLVNPVESSHKTKVPFPKYGDVYKSLSP